MERKIVEGCRLPSDGPLTVNEAAWVDTINFHHDGTIP